MEEASGLSVSAAQLQSESPQDKDAMLWEMVEATGEALDSEEREQLFSLLTEYADIFAIDSKDLGRTDKVQHQIVTGDSAPIRQQVRRVPPAKREEFAEGHASPGCDQTYQQSMGITSRSCEEERWVHQVLCGL